MVTMNTNTTTWLATVHPNHVTVPSDPDNWASAPVTQDVVEVTDPATGLVVDMVYVTETEDPARYDAALAAAGYRNVTWG